MKKFIGLNLLFLVIYPSLIFSAQTQEQETKSEHECCYKQYEIIKNWIYKNKDILGISAAGSALVSATTYNLLLKNKKFAALTTSAISLVTFGLIYSQVKSKLNQALLKAIRDNNYDRAKEIIDDGADVNAIFILPNGNLNYLLLEASHLDYKMIQLLLDNGANEDLIDSPRAKKWYEQNKQDHLNLGLINAIKEQNTENVKYYVEKNACLIEFQTLDSNTKSYFPMVEALQSNREIMKLILEKIDPSKLDVSAVDKKHFDQLASIYWDRTKKETSASYQKEQNNPNEITTDTKPEQKEESPKEVIV